MKVLFEKRTFLILLFLALLVFLYVGARGTYTAYESSVNGNVSNRISQIHLFVNGSELVSNQELDNRIILDNITWTSTHTRLGKMSPGSTGNFQFELAPTGSEVAVLYEMELIDKNVDDSKLLTFTSITSDQNLVRTGISTYSGVFTLSDIEAGRNANITLNFEFDNSEDIEGFTDDDQTYDDFFEINFHASQYQGEVLTPYTE